ncbi:TPR-like protein [Violaceomyces palustris]|uniref:TPR-like protein n=1 Tax=Violaceomyces palustris TaxID=1673888 RepID=A0ACD0NZ20_9BASI|nr:TPR-like protein [Violaceomyces palustris]
MAKAAKAELYAKELDSSRLRGDWAEAISKGKPTSWPELFRKFSKHNPDRAMTANLAEAEQAIRANIESFHKEEAYTDASHVSDYSHEPSASDSTQFPPSMELGENGIGWSSDNVAGLAGRIDELRRSGVNKQAAIPIQALALFTLGRDEDAVSLLHEDKFIETAGAETREDIDQGEIYTLALTLLGFVVYGMANERLNLTKSEPGYAPFALAGYAKAIDLHERIRGGKRANALRGLPADEIERWAEVALYRNALLCVRSGDMTHALNSLRAYQAHAGRWPADFRLPQRNVIYRTYLRTLNRAVDNGTYVDPPALPARSRDDWRSRAFHLNVAATVASRVQVRDYESERAGREVEQRTFLPAGARTVTSRTVSKRRPNPHRLVRPPSVAWSNEVLTVQLAAATSLGRSSDFPRAGQINTAVLDFADELMRGWELNGEQGGEPADEAVDILYSLVRVTFHSQKLARHIFKLLFAAERYDEAKRALDAYIQIVDKGREANAAGAGAQASEGVGKLANGIDKNGHDDGEAERDKVLEDFEDDETYARALILGARSVGTYLKDYTYADKTARKALELLESSKSIKNGPGYTALLALAKRVAGSTRASLAIQLSDPQRRPDLQSEALALLRSSAELDPESSETFFSLAYLQGELRDISSAVFSARKALELEPADIESWHLLTLLLSAQKNYKGALQIAEVALAEAESDDEAVRAGGANGVINAASAKSASFNSPAELLSVDFPPRRSERAESVLRLMMTHNALEEILEGVELAIDGQRDIFTFYHKVFPSGAVSAASASASTGAPRLSISGARPTPSQSGGRLSSILLSEGDGVNGNGNGAIPRRYGSMTAMSQVSSNGGPTATRTRSFGHGQRAVSQGGAGAGAAIAAKARAEDGNDESEPTPSSERQALKVRREATLLARVWLMAAASFRRAGKHQQCRTAIQEAERVQPGLADVWVQLALYFYETKQANLAVNSLYKALACQGDHTAASVHLARLFLTEPNLKPRTNHDAPSPSPRVEEQASSMDGTRSRTLGGTSKTQDQAPGGAKSNYASTAEARLSKVAEDLSSVSLAEGLLNSVTTGSGWDCSEAWYFLAKAVKRSGRVKRERECLDYALKLEQSRPVRDLSTSLRR